MTIKELWEWAVRNQAEDAIINIQNYDPEKGYVLGNHEPSIDYNGATNEVTL